jgi:HAD superfamily hydrolase (TIGR01509 family)
MKKAVVFDMDGVIFDTEPLVMKVWEELGEIHHFDHVKEVCYECIGTNKETSKRIFLKHYGEDFPYDEYAKESSRIYHARYDGKVPLKPGVHELLTYLKDNQYRIALASSTRAYTVKLQLKQAEILDDFEAVITGDMVTASKPDPMIYLTACEAIGVEPKEAYAIEDSYNGIRSAYRAQMAPIMVPDLKAPNEEMYEKSTVILKDLYEVMDYLKKERDTHE